MYNYNEKIQVRIQQTARVAFDDLATQNYLISPQHYKYTRRNISVSLEYDGPKISSDLISVKAKQGYIDGTYSRGQLCEEHFNLRTATADKMISFFDDNYMNVSDRVIIRKFEELVEHGCKVNLVTRQENIDLVKYQKDTSLTPEQHYQLAGIVLVADDYRRTKDYIYESDEGFVATTIPEMAKLLSISTTTVSKWIKKGWITQRELEKNPSWEPVMEFSS